LTDKTQFGENFDFSILENSTNSGYQDAIVEIQDKLLIALEGEYVEKYLENDDFPLEVIFSENM
jgi:hypothetical protein